MRFNYQLQAAITAFQFLTRVPLPGGMNQPNPDLTLLRSAVIYFPIVGGLIGAVTGSIIWGALWLWPPMVAVILGLIAEALLTGAFHEDAVADCCDAFGGGWSQDDVLRIMKDSRIGSFGALGLMLMVFLRGSSLAAIPAQELISTSMASAALGRWAILVLMRFIPPVPKREGLAKDIGERITWQELAAGSLLALPGAVALALLSPWRTSLAVVGILAVCFIWGRYILRRIGGVTGDCLGCGCYLAQCVVLLVASARGLP